MNKKVLNPILIVVGFLLWVGIYTIQSLEDFGPIGLYLVSFIFSFGVINYTKWKTWIKILASLVLAAILSIIVFLIYWGLNTGWEFYI